jgi:glycosyltransferase involved in cell wall biosynthesis
MTSYPIVDVIIPAYNEGQSIGMVIKAIPGGLVRDIIVCNNNSTDDTAMRANEAGAIVVDQHLRGYGNACLAGMKFIHDKPVSGHPDIVVFMDGDYSDYPEEISLILHPILDGKDMVIGSRVLGKSEKGAMTIPQQFGNWLATHLIRILFGYRFTDLGPFRAIRWQKLLELDMQDKTYGWTVEMQVKAVKLKFNCVEVPVSYRKRIGTSKVSGTIKGTILAGYKILWTIFKSI